MKGTQVGATVWAILHCLHALRFAEEVGKCVPKKAGYYFPGQDSVRLFAKDRLRPLLASVPDFANVVTNDSNELIQLGRSSLYLSYTSGVATLDSTPLDRLYVDEVRLMDPAVVDRLKQRLSGSEDPGLFMLSTAGYPGDSIDEAFQAGTQHWWHTRCKCADGVVLPLVFPECVGKRGHGTSSEFFYFCPKCGHEIANPCDGGYVAHSPGAETLSVQISQLLSPTRTARQVHDDFVKTRNVKEAHNAIRGVPYVADEDKSLSREALDACVNHDLSWASTFRDCCMGVDQRSGQLHVAVAVKTPEGKARIVHLEVVDSNHSRYFEDGKKVSPFKRLYRIMYDHDVSLCVLDALPNANEAKDFARAFPGRVFLSYYRDSMEIARWSDRKPKVKQLEKPQLRKSSEELKFRWVVMLDRYKALEYALHLFGERRAEVPNPRGLIQECFSKKTGRFEPTFLCEDIFFLHLRSVARETVESRRGAYQSRWVDLGLDPHFLHAWAYCAVALERKKRGFAFEFL